MYIDCVTNNGKPYLRVAQSYTAKVDGVSKTRKRTIMNIGPMARYDDGKPDYLARLKKSFLEGHPLINGLEELAKQKQAKRKVLIEFDRDSDQASMAAPKNIGYFLLDGLYGSLGIYDVLNKHKSQSKIEYDLNGLSRLLVFSRMLWPDSKAEAYRGKDRFIFDVAESDNLAQTYRALDALHERADAIQARMHYKISHSLGRNTEVCFYDVTNYYFEIGENDADILDIDGRVVEEGTRKKGPSKERRCEPIVQMGLFIDDQGIPIAYRLFPGNHIDQTTLRPALKENINKLSFGRVIIVADGGLNSDKNIAYILKEGNGYILSRSTKKSTKPVREWMLEDSDYIWNEAGTFKVKSKIRKRTIKDEDGLSHEITEKLVCYWSKRHYDREMHENAGFIAYLESVIANPDKLKDKPRKIEKFLKRTEIEKETGEILKTETRLTLDLEKLQDYLNLLGYYTIMTSEFDKSDRDIIDKYHGLSRIEDSFRISKSDLEGRPVYVNKRTHINAHFLICFIALTMVRLIQSRVLKYLGKDSGNENGWESGLSANRIKKALKSFQADALPGGYYRLTKPTEDMQLILNAFGIDRDLRLPTLSDLRQLKYAFDETAIM